MRIVYGVTMALSIMMLIGYLSLIRKKEKWLVLMFVSVAIVNLGYFMLSLAPTVAFALVANKVAYLGQVFLPMAILLTILNLSHLKYNKVLPISLAVIALLIFALVFTTGYLPWYYESVSLVFEDGASKLVKDYGPAHVAYLLYLLLYFGTMIGVIIYVFIKRKKVPIKQAVLMAIVVFGNIAVWGMEQLIKVNFEFLAVSYLLSELLLLGIYWMMQDAERDILRKKMALGQNITNEDKLAILLTRIPDGESLTARETEILYALIAGKKRKEMADELNISENTVKTHVAHVYDKLGISSKDELNTLIAKM